jgi:hypothetical protein
VTDRTGPARARQRFLAAQPLEPGEVHDTILAPWQRSRPQDAGADHIDPCYVRDPGPGMALESGQAAHVFGHEHYAGQLVYLTCGSMKVEAHAQDIDLRSR